MSKGYQVVVAHDGWVGSRWSARLPYPQAQTGNRGIEEWGRANIEREETVGKKKTDPDRTHSGCVGSFGNFSFTKLSSRDVRIEFL